MQRVSLPFVLAAFAVVGCGQSHGPDAGSSAIGDPCAGTSCGDGLGCVADDRFVDGYCTMACGDSACPEGSVCGTTTTPALCLAGCTSSAECRDGYQCWRGACQPRCDTDPECGGGGATCAADRACEGPECATSDDCGPTLVCIGFACVPAPPDGGAMLPHGSPCTRDFDCEGRVCLPAALGGVCSLPCVQADDCFVFASGGGCSALPTDTNGDGVPDAVNTVCVPLPGSASPIGAACTSDDGCEARICQDRQCTEVCDDDGDCLGGQICTDIVRAGASGATYRGCGYTARAGAVAIETHDLGEMTLGAGFIGSLELAVPSDAVSITLQARRLSGDPLDLAFVEEVDPSGVTLFDVSQIFSLVDQPIRWLPVDTGESITMLVPNTTPDRVVFRPGRHRWTVSPIPRMTGDTGSCQVQLSALVKRAAGGTVSSGRIDLNVYLVGVGVNAAAAPSDSRLQGALARFATVYAPSGVSLGSVSYFDITGADATRYSVIDSTDGPDSELAGLFRLSAARTGRTLNIFLVRSISGGGMGFNALGIAGGIPGPPGVHGTQHSGVVVAFDPSVVGSGAMGARVVGHVFAHESGHYLGLFHVTEQQRPCGPGETPDAGCSPFGGGDPLADTTRGDTSNLMHWSIVGTGTNEALSNGQRLVFRLSALVGP